MNQADVDVVDVSCDSACAPEGITQQIQEQSQKYEVNAELSGYTALTRITGLTKGWKNVPLSSIVRIIRGVTYSKTESSDEQKEGLLPVLRANNIQNCRLIFEDLVYVPSLKISEQQKVKQGDIVLAMSSGSRSVVGKAARATNDWIGGFGAFCGVLRPSELIEERYVNWFTSSSEYRNKVSELAAGVNINNLKPSHFDEIFIPLAPFAEQQQIAAKLDGLLTQVDTLKTRLDTVPKILKRFRQSVLAAAVSGKLTENWRKTEILDNWLEANIGQVAIVSTGKTPIRAETAYWENGTVPWLTSATTGKEFCYEAEQFVTEFAVTNCSLKLFKSGTLLLAMYGEGKTRGQVTELKLSATCNQACAAIIVDEKKALRSFVKLRLLENYEETRKAASGGNQPNLNLNKVRDIPILLPPIEEQTEIVHQVEQLFTYADQIEQRVNDAQARVNHLTQAILAKAFRGELTADWREQNPNLISGENGAAALLAKIKAERETITATKKIGKKVKA